MPHALFLAGELFQRVPFLRDGEFRQVGFEVLVWPGRVGESLQVDEVGVDPRGGGEVFLLSGSQSGREAAGGRGGVDVGVVL